MIRSVEVLGTIVARKEDEAHSLWRDELSCLGWDMRELSQDETKIEDLEPAGQRFRYYMRTVYVRNE